jgi:RNA polymerase sigma-70 factor (ECF subfamily)
LRKNQRWQRLRNRLTALFNTQVENPSRPEETALRNEVDRVVWNTIQSLGEKHRIPIILRYYHGLPIAEIAQVLGISEGTVHSRLNTARERIKVELVKVGLNEPEAKNHARNFS